MVELICIKVRHEFSTRKIPTIGGLVGDVEITVGGNSYRLGRYLRKCCPYLTKIFTFVYSVHE